MDQFPGRPPATPDLLPDRDPHPSPADVKDPGGPGRRFKVTAFLERTAGREVGLRDGLLDFSALEECCSVEERSAAAGAIRHSETNHHRRRTLKVGGQSLQDREALGHKSLPKEDVLGGASGQ